MVLVVASFSQIYSRLLGACTFTLSAWMRVAYVAVSFLCRSVWCEGSDRGKGDRAWWEREDEAVAETMATTRVGRGERSGELSGGSGGCGG